MDTLSRKMFQNSEARRKLSQMAGIRGAFPELAQVAARYQDGGPVGMTERIPLPFPVLPGDELRFEDLRGLSRSQLEALGLPVSQLAQRWATRSGPVEVGGMAEPVVPPEPSRPVRREPRPGSLPMTERIPLRFPVLPGDELDFEDLRGLSRSQLEQLGLPVSQAGQRLGTFGGPMPVGGMPGDEPVDPLAAFEENMDWSGFSGLDPMAPEAAPMTPTDRAVAEALRDEPTTDAGDGEQTDTTPAGGAGGGERRDTDPPAADEREIDRILREQFGVEPPSRDPRSRREQMEQRLDLIREVLGEPNRDRARDRAMHLAMIGLAIAAGQSPNALANIAQGALAGTQAMARAQQAERDREDELRMLAYRDLLGEEQDARGLQRDIALARYRASLGGGANPAQGAIDRMYSDTYNNTYRTLLEQNIPPDEAIAQAREVAGSQFPEATIVTQRRMAEVAAQVQQDLQNNVPVAQIRAQILELGLNPDAFEGLSE